jgi:hypothetical protein
MKLSSLLKNNTYNWCNGVFMSLFGCWLVFWLPLCGLVAWAWDKRGQSGAIGFIVSFFFSPLIGLLAGLLLPVERNYGGGYPPGGDGPPDDEEDDDDDDIK